MACEFRSLPGLTLQAANGPEYSVVQLDYSSGLMTDLHGRVCADYSRVVETAAKDAWVVVRDGFCG